MDASSQRENFNHRHTLSISRINPPKFGGGLKFEPVDKSRSAGTPELGKRGRFAKVSHRDVCYTMFLSKK